MRRERHGKKENEREEKAEFRWLIFSPADTGMLPLENMKRDKDKKITEYGLCWPEKVIILPGYRTVGERMDGTRTRGTYFILMR